MPFSVQCPAGAEWKGRVTDAFDSDCSERPRDIHPAASFVLFRPPVVRPCSLHPSFFLSALSLKRKNFGNDKVAH
jgi:hypothetical protein